MNLPRKTPPDGELQRLKQEIAQIVMQREAIKEAIVSGNLPASQGLRQLPPLDTTLSQLDSAFKQLWDAQQ